MASRNSCPCGTGGLHPVRDNFPVNEEHISKRQILRFIAAAMFTAFLFILSRTFPVTPYNTDASANTPCRTQPARLEETPVTEFPLVSPGKDDILSVIDTLSTDENTMLSIPAGFGSRQEANLQKIIDSLLQENYNISFILLEIDTGNVICLNPDSTYYSASTIKGPYVAALNKFSPEPVSDSTKSLMKNTIMWSSNEDFETLHNLYGNEALYKMTEYTDVSDSIIDEYNWYPYLTPKELAKLWIGIYWYFFEDTNENSKWCQSLFTDSLESFINSALSHDGTVYTKPGWYMDWEDIARNDAGILLIDGRAYILTIMSDAFDSYDELEELAAVLGKSVK